MQQKLLPNRLSYTRTLEIAEGVKKKEILSKDHFIEICREPHSIFFVCFGCFASFGSGSIKYFIINRAF